MYLLCLAAVLSDINGRYVLQIRGYRWQVYHQDIEKYQ